MSMHMDLLTSKLGITYRQLDFWVRQGYLHPRHKGGSGNARDFTGEEELVLTRMARLVNAGIRPDVAARAARNVVIDHGTSYVRLGDNVLVKTCEASHG